MPTIDLIRFSISGNNNQFYNYIPLLNGMATKVNINYVLHIDQKSLTEMKKYKCNKIAILIDDTVTYKDIPVEQLTDKDFLNLTFSFLLHDDPNNHIDHLDLKLGYGHQENNTKDIFFTTSIPVERKNKNAKQII